MYLDASPSDPVWNPDHEEHGCSAQRVRSQLTEEHGGFKIQCCFTASVASPAPLRRDRLEEVESGPGLKRCRQPARKQQKWNENKT